MAAKKSKGSKKVSKKVAKKAAKKVSQKIAKVAKKASKKASEKAEKAESSSAPKTSGASIIHWEIQSQTPEKLHGFYREVFGWTIDANNPMNYGMVASKGSAGIDGGIGGSQQPGSRVVVYAGVSSINATLKKIERAGGTTVMPRTDIGAVVMALYTDPEGNMMGLVEG